MKFVVIPISNTQKVIPLSSLSVIITVMNFSYIVVLLCRIFPSCLSSYLAIQALGLGWKIPFGSKILSRGLQQEYYGVNY